MFRRNDFVFIKMFSVLLNYVFDDIASFFSSLTFLWSRVMLHNFRHSYEYSTQWSKIPTKYFNRYSMMSYMMINEEVRLHGKSKSRESEKLESSLLSGIWKCFKNNRNRKQNFLKALWVTILISIWVLLAYGKHGVHSMESDCSQNFQQSFLVDSIWSSPAWFSMLEFSPFYLFESLKLNFFGILPKFRIAFENLVKSKFETFNELFQFSLSLFDLVIFLLSLIALKLKIRWGFACSFKIFFFSWR